MNCKHNDCGWCMAPSHVIQNANVDGSCNPNSCPQSPTPTWIGEGLPTVGTYVDVCDDESLRYGHGESGEVIAHVENTAVIRMSYGLGCFTARHLRPTQTPRERWIEAAKCVFDTVSDEFTPTNNASLDTLFSAMHDAMQSGTLPIPEVDQ